MPGHASTKIYPPALKTLRDPIGSGPIKSFWAPESKVDSPYQHLIPEIPDPSTVALDRERIIREGTVPSIVPAVIGLRMWLAEQQIRRHQQAAEQLLDRKARVAAYVGEQVINQVGYQGFDQKYRPKKAAEKIMAWRMHAKWYKATDKNLQRNSLAAPYRVVTSSPEEDAESIRLDFEKNLDHASFTEKRRAGKSKKQHARLGRQVSVLMHGRTVPVTGKRVNGFEQFITKPVEKAHEAVEKRDKAILKAEALRRAKATRSR